MLYQLLNANSVGGADRGHRTPLMLGGEKSLSREWNLGEEELLSLDFTVLFLLARR